MNKGFAILLVLWALCLVAACSNSTSEYLEENPSGSEDKVVPSDTTEIDTTESDTVSLEMEGMIAVRGGTVTLGSDDAKYRPSERPAMKVRLEIGRASCRERV